MVPENGHVLYPWHAHVGNGLPRAARLVVYVRRACAALAAHHEDPPVHSRGRSAELPRATDTVPVTFRQAVAVTSKISVESRSFVRFSSAPVATSTLPLGKMLATCCARGV